MGAAGRAHIEAHHDLPTQAAKLEDLYDRVLYSPSAFAMAEMHQ
jgi:hypothetical protein